MNYTEKDFSKCIFNPCVDNIFKSYPQLNLIKEIYSDIEDKLIKYIICVYDYNSPIVMKHRDLKVRKQQAAEFSGYEVMSDSMEGIYSLSDTNVLKCVDTFLKKFIHNRTWYMICANESIFWEYGQRMLQPVGNKDEGGKQLSEKDLIAAMQAKTKLSEDMQGLDDRLDVQYKRLYGGEIVDKFLSSATTPERMAKERFNNK